MTLLVSVAVPLLVAALLGMASPALARRLPPATATRLLVVASLVTAGAFGFGLAVTAFSVIAQSPELAAAGHWSAQALRRLVGVPTPLGLLAGALMAGLLASALVRAGRVGRQLWHADLRCRELGAHVDGLVIVEDARPDAYAMQGLRGRVVVSTGMLGALSPAERRVLFAHEAAHLAHRHVLLVQLVDVAAAANPLLRPVARVVRDGVERWADEEAAASVGDRRLAARALARAALAVGAAPREPVRLSAALAMADGMVAARARALLAPAPRPRRALAATVLAATLAAGTSALIAGHVTESNVERAQQVHVAGTLI